MHKNTRLALPPDGFRYAKDIVTPVEEDQLIANIEALPLKEFEFHGYSGKRRVLSFGWHYDFSKASLSPRPDIPEFLQDLRAHAARFAGLDGSDLRQALVTEYTPGTPIGWHRDKAVFEDVIGISLLSRCPFRFRRKAAGGWERYTHLLEPRSVYLLRGPARLDWEHSIAEVGSLRYSVTFRTLTHQP